jgi:phosphatidylglycerophosphate synthase
MLDTQKIGEVLLIMGVLAWAPFLILVAMGEEPSIYPFLAVHLTGVIGGSRLRARGKDGETKQRSRRQVTGKILILLGVLAWAPYLYQKDILGEPVEIGLFLAAHLTGVLTGIALLLSVALQNYLQKSRQSALPKESMSG